VKSNKENFGKFRYKPLANEELLRTLFLDSLATGANVTTPHEIAIKGTDNAEDADADADGEPAEEELYTELATELNKEQRELDTEEAIDATERAKTPPLSTPTTPRNPSISTSSSTSSLKRLAADQDTPARKRKQTAPKLFVQAIGGLSKKIDNIAMEMAAEAKT